MNRKKKQEETTTTNVYLRQTSSRMNNFHWITRRSKKNLCVVYLSEKSNIPERISTIITVIWRLC